MLLGSNNLDIIVSFCSSVFQDFLQYFYNLRENICFGSIEKIDNDAEIVILDEPTVALDPMAELDVFSCFQKLSKDKTSIMISHRLGPVIGEIGGESALEALIGGVLIVFALFYSISYFVKLIFKLLLPVFEFIGGRVVYVAVKNMIALKKQNSFIYDNWYDFSGIYINYAYSK
jgi:hypothetical protein